MILAATLGFYLIGMGPTLAGWLPPGAHGFAASGVNSSSSFGQQAPGSSFASQAPAPQAPNSTQPAPSQTPSATGQTKPSTTRAKHHKKTIPPNCSDAPVPLNPAVGNPADSKASTTAPAPGDAASPNTDSAALKPCPPPKKVVRNGGSDEPTVHLTGGTTAEQAVHQRSTDQLTAATEENLKQIEGRQITPAQQEMVNQINQFMKQSRAAVASGDLERGHDLALKAHLLSDELVKP